MGLLLSPLQQQIVNHDTGPLLVMAGPGSGKTRVLTERVKKLLTQTHGHFKILALTFTNKAANEMQERLENVGEAKKRATISTLHKFCCEMLADRGKHIGITTLPHIFERAQDRKQILVEAALKDPLLSDELVNLDQKARNQRLDDWMRGISLKKSHPITMLKSEDELEERVYESYNAGLRASGACDYDDLLLLAYQLLTSFPAVADFYRRAYSYICIDEAQDLNEAQYGVLKALCGTEFKNVMMVGDPKQSIYGFNTSSPRYMDDFVKDFGATKIELIDNFRSSRVVVNAAKALEPKYTVEGQLPVEGMIKCFATDTEEEEAQAVCEHLKELFTTGNPDVEGSITPKDCAILGRNRFSLLKIEDALKKNGVPFYKRLSSLQEYESDIIEHFQLALRVYSNPLDLLHLASLAKAWGQNIDSNTKLSTPTNVIDFLKALANTVNTPKARAVVDAIQAIAAQTKRTDINLGIKELRKYADTLTSDDEKRSLYDDTEVLIKEWDQYLRSQNSSGATIAGFLSSMALGVTQQPVLDGVALLTVHSSKGLEFNVVFMVGMVDGVFPDYRSRADRKALEEETRNAFVAVTRSRRLLFLSMAKTRVMPWGDVWKSQASPFILQIYNATKQAQPPQA